ncbi:hypothetical protein COT99_04185 [Candidatus Falkowbacteria bacterium CG10_big_fil_rev_8_21_14_0_10_43_10]|uniref:Uncharacterized protein n=1 Tax=Candidatus Falkowbacteria bacterium CG10_big_fil_rev_8_21_14_0_10_43_10 TaxID=1974567 RepID=A0A2H0V134_9BACT|nr:MAG: hypothetical protein COT99_04185 [Candidatus Falkowbacteria bacterium CG10_big_fil_rev_8_21_14_0_10_43_10]
MNDEYEVKGGDLCSKCSTGRLVAMKPFGNSELECNKCHTKFDIATGKEVVLPGPKEEFWKVIFAIMKFLQAVIRR